MRKLTEYDMTRSSVHTIGQYKILDYLKQHLNIYEFKIYLINRNTVKVVDKEDNHLYFKYNEITKEISYQDELVEKENEKDFEVSL